MDAPRHYDALIDARGLACPLPLIRARQALMVLEVGATVAVLATDPAAQGDFERFSEASGHELLSIEQADEAALIVLRKAG
ncbi:MAG: sulfurtransferase TusA family protein [Geminicoccaceae bacterium]|nr:sulfurtransferase TusA family protein [Geminicoccaceae bacterium]